MFEELSELYRGIPDRVNAQQCVRERFRALVRCSWMNLWKPGDPIETCGLRVLLGVAVGWNEYDRTLLSRLDALHEAGKIEDVYFDVFDTDDCKSQADLQTYFPGIGFISQMPVVGIWKDGILMQYAQGYPGRQLLEMALRVTGLV